MAKKPAKPTPKRKATKNSPKKRRKQLTGKEKRQAQKARAANLLINTEVWYKRTETHLMAVAMVFSFLVYILPLNYGFVNWDDPEYVTENIRVLNPSGDNILKFWTDVSEIGERYSLANAHNYHPLTMTTIALTQKIFGDNPLPHHLINIILHVLNVMLVFMFVRRFSKGNNLIAFFVAFVFGVHPMHVESVAWVTERKDVLFALFYLWAMIQYLNFLERKESKFLIYTGILFLLSLFSKPTAATLPGVLLLIDYYYKRPLLDSKVILEKVPFLIFGVIFIYLTYRIQEAEAIGDFSFYTIGQRIMFAGYGFVMYIAKLFVPIKLVTFYPYPDLNNIPAIFYAAPIITVLIGAATIYSMRKTRIIAFGMGFYLALVILTLQFITVGSTVMSDRYTYLAYIGLLIVLGYGLDYLVKQKPALKTAIYATTAAVMLVWTYVGFDRTKVWENDFTLWDDVIQKYPDSKTGAYMQRGKYFKDTGQMDLAMADFNKEIEVDPTNVKAINNRGNIYFGRNQNELALQDYNAVIARDSITARYFDNRGAIYARMGNYRAAIKDMNKAISLDPEFANTYKNLGVCYSAIGQFQQSADAFAKYLRIFPNDFNIHNARGIALQGYNNHQEAIQVFSTAIRLQPNNGGFYGNRAKSYAALGQKQQGLADINKGLQEGLNRDALVEEIIQQLNALP